MSQLDQQVASRLTRFYVLALAVLAVLSLSGLLFIRKTIADHYDDSRVVNVAGRQRMLSQRLTKLALLRAEGIPAADTVSFDSLLHDWSQTHIQLRNGQLAMEKTYMVRKSPTLDRMFAEIEPSFQAIDRGFRQINAPGATDANRRAALALILLHELPFVQRMNAIVFQIDTESFERVRTLERIEWLLTIATLLTLVIEGIFIFRPVVNHTQTVIRRLGRSEKELTVANYRLELANRELEATNQNLAASNQKLRDTQAELVRIAEEKHRLQMAEANVRSAALLEGQEEERKRFARELHDGIGQMLTGLKLYAEKLKSTAGLDEKQRIRFAELCELIADIIQTTRQISYNLMPSTLSDFGLGATLQLLAEQSTRSSGIPVVFDGHRDGKRLNPALEIGLYRIAQEALHNAIKYANAPLIRITFQQDEQRVRLSVEDNGRGFPMTASDKWDKPSLSANGLVNMRTRARLLNGELTITSKPKKGTTVHVSFNLPGL